jgi:G3E family GTPase
MMSPPHQSVSVFSSPSEGSPSGNQSPAAATMDHHQDHEAAPNSSAESLHGQPSLPMSRDGSYPSLHSLNSCPSSPRVSPSAGNKRRSVDMDLLQNRQRKRLHDFGGLSSVCVTTVGDFDEAKLNTFMRQLLSDKATDIFRTKGVLHVHVSPPAPASLPFSR